MKPELGTVAGLTIYTYGLCHLLAYMAIALMLALLLGWRRANRAAAIDLSILMVLGYSIGARLLCALVAREWTFFTRFELSCLQFDLWGGQVAFALLAAVYLMRCRGPLPALADALAVGWAGVTVIHKVGCFLAGCCYGRPTSMPWAVTFPEEGMGALPGQPLHPTQLYDAGAALVACGVLAAMYVGRRQATRLLLWWGLVYGASKFASEWFRADDRFPVAGAFTASMLVELAAVALGTTLLAWRTPWDRLLAWHERREAAGRPLSGPRWRPFGIHLAEAIVAAMLGLVAGLLARNVLAGVVSWAGIVLLGYLVAGGSPLARLLGYRAVTAAGLSPGLARRLVAGFGALVAPLTLLGMLRPLLDRSGRSLGQALAGTSTSGRERAAGTRG